MLATREATASRESARTLERQNERLDRFASVVSRDLRHPLSAAAGRLARFRETGDPKHLDAVEDAPERMEGPTIVRRVADAHDLDVSLTESPEGGGRFEFRARGEPAR